MCAPTDRASGPGRAAGGAADAGADHRRRPRPGGAPGNAEFLHARLPRSKLDLLDAGHFTWEDAADEYAALITSWWGGGYATAEAAAAR